MINNVRSCYVVHVAVFRLCDNIHNCGQISSSGRAIVISEEATNKWKKKNNNNHRTENNSSERDEPINPNLYEWLVDLVFDSICPSSFLRRNTVFRI